MVRISRTVLLIIAGLAAGIALSAQFIGTSRSGAQESLPARNETVAATGLPDSQQMPGAFSPRAVPQSAGEVKLSYAPIVERASPAVVNIYTAKVVRGRGPMINDPLLELLFGGRGGLSRERIERSLGSGVIVSADGLIVTNKHVVGEADEIRVVLADRREFAAEVLVSDDQSDLAVIRLAADGAELPVLPLGTSDDILVGDLVLAIGNPFGVGQTVTQGIVSALRSGGEGPTRYQYYIQTDAAINPGNSGGALVDMNGRLIGINTFIYSRTGGSVGIGFAVPVNLVRSLIAAAGTGQIVRPWLGLVSQGVDSDTAEALGMGQPAGVLVNRVSPGSPAGAAGVRAGDVILAIDGRPVFDPQTLDFQVATRMPGARVGMTLLRQGAQRDVAITLIAPPDTPARDVTQLAGGHAFAGITVANLNPAFVQELARPLPDYGVIVLQVSRSSLAARLGLVRPGDILESINGQPVDTVAALRQALLGASEDVTFGLQRGGQRGQCVIRPPRQAGCR